MGALGNVLHQIDHPLLIIRGKNRALKCEIYIIIRENGPTQFGRVSG